MDRVNRVALGGESFKSWNPRARQSSAMARAVAEAMESRRYLAAPELLDYDQYATYEGEDISLYLEIIDPDNMGITFLTIDWDNGEIPSEWVPDVDFSTEDWIIHSSYFDNPAAPETAHHATITATDADNETGTFYVDLIADNANPVATIDNSGAINEGGTVTVSLSDAIDLGTADMSAGLRYSFATSYGALAGSYSAAGSTPSAAFTPTDDGTKTYYARVLDKDDGYTDYSTTVAVANVAPFATLTFSDPDSSGNVTVSLDNAHDPSTSDTSAGFKYAFNLVYNSLPSTYAAASSSSSQVFSEAQLADGAIVYARIFDPTGYRNYQIGTTDMSAQVVSSSQINLTWTDDVTDELGWRVQWSDDGSFGTGHVWYVNLAADVDHYEAIDVPDGTRRWYRVRAFSDAIHPGESIYSPKMAATTILPPPTNLVASNLNHSPTDMDIEVTWDVPSQNHTGFTLKRFAAGVDVSTASPLETQNLGSGATSYTFEEYEPGDLFQFTLQATGAYGPSVLPLEIENRTDPVEAWSLVYEDAPNEDFHIGATWTESVGGDYGPEVVEFTLTNLPRHSYAAVEISLSVSSGDAYWPTGYPAPTADADGTPLEMYEDSYNWMVELSSYGGGPNAFEHDASEMTVSIDLSDLPEGSTWYVQSAVVWTYYPYVGFTYDVTSAAEEGGDGILTVGRFGAAGTVAEHPMTIRLVNLGGSASAGTDYDLPGSITIPAGHSSAFVHFGVIDDETPEWTEDLTVRLPKKVSEYIRPNEVLVEEYPDYFDRKFEIADDDLYISNLPEYVDLNSDDEDETIDMEEEIPASPDYFAETGIDGENDLYSLELTVPEDVKSGATVTIGGPNGLIRIWENPDRSGTLFIGENRQYFTWVIGEDEVPDVVWVEVFSADDDIVVGLQASDQYATPAPLYLYTETQAQTAPATPNSINLQMRDLPSNIEDTLGGLVLINADNDNGSAVTNGIPDTRDYAVTTQVNGESGEMGQLFYSGLPTPGESEQRKLRLSWTGSKIRVWKVENKSQAALTSPVEWTLGQQPQTLFLEGIELSAAEGEMTFTLQLLDAGNNVIGSDSLKASVGPILTALAVTRDPQSKLDIKAGTNTIATDAAVAEKGANLSSAALVHRRATTVGGSLVFVQNTWIRNEIDGPHGADVDGVLKGFAFAAPHAGAILLDVANVGNAPTYTLTNSDLQDRNVTITSIDFPALPMTGIVPGAGGTTDLDVSYAYRLHTAWRFPGNILYFLGYTQWEVHYVGVLNVPLGGALAFAPGGGAGVVPSTGFTKSQTVPVLTTPYANSDQAGAAWS